MMIQGMAQKETVWRCRSASQSAAFDIADFGFFSIFHSFDVIKA
jgi:hypothetical protein